MKSYPRSRRGPLRALAVIVGLVAGVLFVVGGPLGATAITSAPSFEPDPGSVGSVSFYDAAGTQITSGSINDDPMAAYYVASGAGVAAGDTKAQVAYATPQDGVATQSWTTAEFWTSSQTYGPAITYPGSLAGSTNAIAHGVSGDFAFSLHISDFPNQSTQDPGIYQVRLYTTHPGSAGNDTYYSADILVTGSTWTQVYPDVSAPTATTTALTAGPASPQPAGTAVTLTATLAPSDAAGSVQFKDGTTVLGDVPVASGSAQLVTGALALGTHSFTATFTPTDSAAFAASTSAPVGYTIAGVPSAPATPTVTAGHGAATVSWVAPANGGAAITGYDLQYSSNGGTSWLAGPVAAHTSTATSRALTGLVNGAHYVFHVAAINAIGTGAYSPTSAAATPFADATGLLAHPSVLVNYGTATTISATLTDLTTGRPVSGAGVRLLVRNLGAPWGYSRTLVTSSTGVVQLSVRPSKQTQFAWQYVGTVEHAAASSAIEVVSVAQVVRAWSTAGTVGHGVPFKIYGTVSPTQTGSVVLYRRAGTTWQSTGAVARLVRQTLPNHATTVGYVFTLSIGSRGTFVYRVIRGAVTGLAAGGSAALSVKVV